MVPTAETVLFGIDVVKALDRLDDKVDDDDDDGRWELWDALLLLSGKFNWKTVAAGEVESPVVLPGIQTQNTSYIITTYVILLCSLHQYMFSLSLSLSRAKQNILSNVFSELENLKCRLNLTRN